MGERIHGMDEVRGSIPLSSTENPSARLTRASEGEEKRSEKKKGHGP